LSKIKTNINEKEKEMSKLNEKVNKKIHAK
jgi:hypothetical protein